MKLKTAIVIDADRATVWRLFVDHDHLKHWQPTLQSFRHVSGSAETQDAVTELVYDENGRKVTLTETITARREPDFIGGTYASELGSVVVLHRFEDTPGGRTRWTGHWNQGFTGAMKYLAFLFRPKFRRRVRDDMARFKAFVESRRGH